MSGKKETVLDLGKFIDKGVRVKLSGGREGASRSTAAVPRIHASRQRRASFRRDRRPFPLDANRGELRAVLPDAPERALAAAPDYT
jgi:hypothetical protein